MEALSAIREILEETLNIDPENVTEESTLESLGLDSLDVVELIFELESRLDVSLLELDGIETVGDLVAYAESLL